MMKRSIIPIAVAVSSLVLGMIGVGHAAVSSTSSTSVTTSTPTAFQLFVPRSTLWIYVLMDNTLGGTAKPGNFLITVDAGHPHYQTFHGNASGSTSTIDAYVPYTVNISTLPDYQALRGATSNCGPNTLPPGGGAYCTITEKFIPPPPPDAVPSTTSATSTGEVLGASTTDHMALLAVLRDLLAQLLTLEQELAAKMSVT